MTTAQIHLHDPLSLWERGRGEGSPPNVGGGPALIRPFGAPSPRGRRNTKQRGAALATALIFLVILTLLGLTAMRVGQTNLRLTLNEESRIDALQSAQSLLDSVLNNNTTTFAIQPGSGYLQSCFLGTTLVAATMENEQGFTCPSAKTKSDLPPDDTRLKKYAYISVRREQVGSSDFAPVAALRKGDSGERFRLANFTVTAGYDRSAENMSAAEIVQGTYIKVDTVDGITQQ